MNTIKLTTNAWGTYKAQVNDTDKVYSSVDKFDMLLHILKEDFNIEVIIDDYNATRKSAVVPVIKARDFYEEY